MPAEDPKQEENVRNDLEMRALDINDREISIKTDDKREIVSVPCCFLLSLVRLSLINLPQTPTCFLLG